MTSSRWCCFVLCNLTSEAGARVMCCEGERGREQRDGEGEAKRSEEREFCSSDEDFRDFDLVCVTRRER